MNDKTIRNALTAAASLEDATIVDRDGEDLGQLEEILLRAESGRVAYAVLSYGNLFDQGFRYVAVPWDAMTVDADGGRVVLDADRERLDAAPRFVKGGWPTAVDDAWLTDLFRNYGLQYEPREGSQQGGGPR